MGFSEDVKEFIDRMRAAGKTKEEIEKIIADAAERATVNKKQSDKETNNWRKQHGLPLKRKKKERNRNGKGKRAKCD